MRAMIRAFLSVILAAGLWSAVSPIARADAVEMLMVPSAAMGRDIPVAFQGGGPHAVVLLDAFNAGPDVSNWVTAGNAMNTLAGKGISVAAPAGGVVLTLAMGRLLLLPAPSIDARPARTVNRQEGSADDPVCQAVERAYRAGITRGWAMTLGKRLRALLRDRSMSGHELARRAMPTE